jgi:PAS domain S-box-containing protein
MSERLPPSPSYTGSHVPERPQADIDVVDLVEESVAVFGFDMRVTAWNAEAERLYGWKRSEVVGGVIQAAVRCSPSEPLRVILARVHEIGSWRGEFSRTTKSGGTVVVAARWSLRRDADGRPLDIVETSRDVTVARRTEEALERVQHQYQTLFQASTAAFWELDIYDVEAMVRTLDSTDRDHIREYLAGNLDYVRQLIRATRIVDVNAQCLAMFGSGDRQGLLGNFDLCWPDESLDVFADCVAAASEGKPHFSSEAVLCSITGQRFSTLFTVSYPQQGSCPTRLLAGVVDLTEAKRARAEQEASERRYRDLFHFVPLPLMRLENHDTNEIFMQARAAGVVDFAEYVKESGLTDRLLDGVKIKEVNAATVTMFRAGSTDEFVGSVARYWTESPDVFRQVVAARYAGKTAFEGLIKVVAHDGAILDTLFYVAFAPITGQQNNTLVGMIDITDRIRAQEMLARVQAEVAHAARVSVLGELTASIAHEVSQPLTAIETNTEASLLWLAHTPPNIEEVRELSLRTAAEAERAAGIIHRIRSMAIRAAPVHEVVDLNLIIDEAVLFLRHELQRNGVATTLRLSPALPGILGDRVQLQQVVVNLGLNAIQAMAAGGRADRVLTIRTFVRDDGRIGVEVEDTGPGLDAAALSQMFESFYTTKENGMGIGLPICRSIIEAHGGALSAANRSDRTGARFGIILPGAVD